MARFLRRLISTDHDVWLEMVLDYDPDLEGRTEKTWQSLLNPESGRTGLVVECDDKPVGFMHHVFHDHTFMDKPVCYLADLYVHPDYRRRGIASMLIRHLLDRAKTENWQRVYWVTEKDNPARELYDKFASDDFVRYHADL